MEQYFLYGAVALCLFSLWAIGRHDWVRLTRPSRRVLAEVIGHRSSWEDSSYTYAPTYAFTDEAGRHEVVDMVYRSVPRPDVGTMVELAYPAGRPELARRPQILLWLAVYALFFALTGLLIAKALGYIPG